MRRHNEKMKPIGISMFSLNILWPASEGPCPHDALRIAPLFLMCYSLCNWVIFTGWGSFIVMFNNMAPTTWLLSLTLGITGAMLGFVAFLVILMGHFANS